MPRSRKIFLAALSLFILLLLYASYDIGKRTSFPGSKPQLQERLREQYSAEDSSMADSLDRNSHKK